jgi:predicted dehydrogenase
MSYENEWKHFAQCIRDGRTPESTFADGFTAAKVVCAALQSASTSESVNLSRIGELTEA